MPLPRGTGTLGGSSSVSGHIYNRGQRLDFDGWAQRGNHGWGYSDVLPYFRRTERRMAGAADATFRGDEGKLPITDLEWRDPLCEAFIEGAVQMGIPRNNDYNGARQQGVSYVQRIIQNGRRVSAARGYLHPAMSRRNLTVRTHAHATELMLEGKRAAGIPLSQGQPRWCRDGGAGDEEVILCGGAVNTPQLHCRCPGVGPAPLLQSLGIEVRHALAGVGENLRDHYAPRFVARVKNAETINELRSHGLRLAGEGDQVRHRPQGHHSPQSDADLRLLEVRRAGRQLRPPAHLHAGELQGEGVQSRLDDYPGMTIASWQQRPDSTDYVRAKSSDPFQAPVIQPNYLAAEGDRQVLLAGMKLARRLLMSKALSKYYDREEFPGAQAQSDDDLMTAAKQRGTTTFHLMGTCRMAPASDPTAVVDDQLRVRGLECLRIVDTASVMPTMPSANLTASVLMIAEKAADLIRGKAPPEPVRISD